MTKVVKKRSRISLWVIGLLAGAVGAATLRNGGLTAICIWTAIILAITGAIRSSPKPSMEQVVDDERHVDDGEENNWHDKWSRDRRDEDDYYQDGFDAEQRDHEDHGEV